MPFLNFSDNVGQDDFIIFKTYLILVQFSLKDIGGDFKRVWPPFFFFFFVVLMRGEYCFNVPTNEH